MRMKKRWLPVLLLLLTACSREEVIVQVVRNPLIEFSAGTFSWRASNHSFRTPARVVQYPSAAAQSGQLYTRYTLEATGRDNRGQQMQFTMQFDAAGTNRLTGEYRPTYTTQRGLAAVQLFNLDENNLASYRLCSTDTANARLVIQRQSERENLIAGTFQMTLCNERDTSIKLVISDGVITDIRLNP
jgi:hypothetical protein